MSTNCQNFNESSVGTFDNIDDMSTHLMNDWVPIFLNHVTRKINKIKIKYNQSNLEETRRNLSYKTILGIFCTSKPVCVAQFIWDNHCDSRELLLAKLNISRKRWSGIIKTCPNFKILCAKYTCHTTKSNVDTRILILRKKIQKLRRLIDYPINLDKIESSVEYNDIFNKNTMVFSQTRYELLNRIKLYQQEINNITRMKKCLD